METIPTSVRLEREVKRHLEDKFGGTATGLKKLALDDFNKDQQPNKIITKATNLIEQQEELINEILTKAKRTKVEGNMKEKHMAEETLSLNVKLEKRKKAKLLRLKIIVENSQYLKEFKKDCNNGLAENISKIIGWADKFTNELRDKNKGATTETILFNDLRKFLQKDKAPSSSPSQSPTPSQKKSKAVKK